MPAKNYASTRFGELAEINEANVKNLQVAFTFSTGVNKGQEAAPLVVRSTMYIVTPFPNTVYALDLSKPGAPMKWKYEPNPEPAAQGVACCDVVNRSAAFADGHVFFNTLDAHTIALDANTGQPSGTPTSATSPLPSYWQASLWLRCGSTVATASGTSRTWQPSDRGPLGHACKHAGCGKDAGWGFARPRQPSHWFCFEHRSEGERFL